MPEPKAQTELTHFRLINLLKLQMEQVAPALRLLLVLLHKLGVIQDQVVPGSKQVGSLLPVQLEPLEPQGCSRALHGVGASDVQAGLRPVIRIQPSSLSATSSEI